MSKHHNLQVDSIVYNIFICHLKPFLNEQRVFKRYITARKTFLKTPEKETSADHTEQPVIIKFCDDLGETLNDEET